MTLRLLNLDVTERLKDHAFAVEYVEALNEEIAAARLAGKIEGLKSAEVVAQSCLVRLTEFSHSDWASVERMLNAIPEMIAGKIRAKIAELEATTTPALPGSSEQEE